jgi:hypothetical protein
MALTHLQLADIREDHLQRLIAAQAAESLHVEYKRETYGGSDEQRREFLADVSSFANASGGDLVIGMTAANGVPTEINPFAGDGEMERLRLEQMARDGLQPRIANLQTQAIPLSQGGCVIVVRVPRSYNQPHRIIFKNSGRFWARSSAGKYEPNVEELRRIFIEAPLLAERIRAFRIDRVSKIAAGDAPVVLAGNCLLILHVVPYSSFNLATPLSVEELETKWYLFPPLGRGQATHRYVNFDGFVVLSNGDPAAAQHHSYAQVFRSGIVEAVATIARSDGAVLASNIDKYCVANSKKYIDAMSKFEVGCPIAILASLIGVSGRTMESGIDGLFPRYGEQKIRPDHLHFSEVILDRVPSNLTGYAFSFYQLLEQIWNTAGFSSQQSITNSKWMFGS